MIHPEDVRNMVKVLKEMDEQVGSWIDYSKDQNFTEADIHPLQIISVAVSNAIDHFKGLPQS